ncbi:MAG: NFACT family protein [Clostridiales bacterium]|nr:NFACT family protein [Clostridiales bacterium]
MPLDGISSNFLAKELQTKLTGARIDKIYQPTRFEVYMLVRSNSENYKLLLSCDPKSPRVQITANMKENPQMPPNFCMLLRKHLSGARILDISCPDYERIITISVSTTDELHDTSTKYLVIEMMGRYSNIIFLNQEKRIIDAVVHVDSSTSRVREIMPARIYEAPPSQGKLSPSEALEKLERQELPILDTAQSRPLGKALLDSLLGFSPLLTSDICFRAGLDTRESLASLSDSKKQKLIGVMRSIISDIVSVKPSPCVLFSDGEPSDWHALNIQDGGKIKPVPTISEALDEVWGYYDRQQHFEDRRRQLRSIVQYALSHESKKLSIHEDDLNETKDAEKLKEQGELILAYQYLVHPGDLEINIPDYPDFGQNTVISLDPNKSASDQGQNLLRRYRKAISRRDAAKRFIEQESGNISYFQSLIQAIDAASEEEDLKAIAFELSEEGVRESTSKESKKNASSEKYHPGKSKSGKMSSRALRQAAQKAKQKQNKSKTTKKPEDSSSPRRYIVDGGLEVLSGRNNIQNDNLTFHVAEKEDLWFHAKNMPGTHVILRTQGKTPSDKAIVEAASIAAYYSRSNKVLSGEKAETKTEYDIRVDIDYCPVSHVKKLPKAKPGMVTYDTYNSLLVSAALPNHQGKKQ